MRIAWNTDGSIAHLYDDDGYIVASWFRDNPELSTFDPQTYQYGEGSVMPGVEGYGGQGAIYDVTQPGGLMVGGVPTAPVSGLPPPTTQDYYYDEARLSLEEFMRQFDLTQAEAIAAREEFARQFDEDLQYRISALEQEMALAREQMAHQTGLLRQEWEYRFQMAEQEHGYAVQLLQLDWRERQALADKELAMRLREIEGQERITAAERWARPIDYLAYSAWLQGQEAAVSETGLPPGAPMWQTGEPITVEGARPTGDVYGAQLAAGGRVSEFGAWGGPTTPVEGTPWVAPHQTNITQFARMPQQAQEMAYARWRHRGITPETAYQTLTASAPIGTAGSAIQYG